MFFYIKFSYFIKITSMIFKHVLNPYEVPSIIRKALQTFVTILLKQLHKYLKTDIFDTF